MSGRRRPQLGASFPIGWKNADVAAMQALVAGTATPDQQQHALRWIVEQAAGAYEVSYDPENPHETSFAEGRRFVGLQIVKLTKLNLQNLPKETK